jgi:hypothetical protein
LSERLLRRYVPEAREYLVKAARDHRTVPYGEIMNRIGGRGYVGQVLDALNVEENDQRRPLLSAIVVRKDARRSSYGFFDLVRRLRPGVPIGDDQSVWEAECDRIWKHYASN